MAQAPCPAPASTASPISITSFLNGTKTNVADTPIGSAGDRLWGGLGAGGANSWADGKLSVYGEVLANSSLENFADSHSYTVESETSSSKNEAGSGPEQPDCCHGGPTKLGDAEVTALTAAIQKGPRISGSERADDRL